MSKVRRTEQAQVVYSDRIMTFIYSWWDDGFISRRDHTVIMHPDGTSEVSCGADTRVTVCIEPDDPRFCQPIRYPVKMDGTLPVPNDGRHVRPSKRLPSEGMLSCLKCGKEYPATTEYFYLRTNKKTLTSHCKSCISANWGRKLTPKKP